MNDPPNKFGIFSQTSDPDLNIPVTGGRGAALSPFLNFDPRIVNDSDKYILPEGAGHQRGRFEMAFAQIGTSMCAGAALGGASGLYRGIIDTSGLIEKKVRRTQVLNFITKRAASAGQAVGVVALIYSIFGTAVSKARGVEDELNTLTAATATGLAFKSTAGLRPCLKGGALGFGLAAAYCLFTSKDKIRSLMSR